MLITSNGIVQHCTYELIVDNNSIIINNNEITELYDIINIQNDFLSLYKISTRENLNFINKTKIKDAISHQLKILQTNKENERLNYGAPSQFEFGFLTHSNNWENNNPGKTVFDYIDSLEKKHSSEKYANYVEWKKHNPDKTRYDFGEYLFNKYEQKIS